MDQTWLHLSGVEELDSLDVPPDVLVHLVDDGTRPFLLEVEGGFVINLRAVNFSADHPIEDMISIRCWLKPDRLVTVTKQPVRAVGLLKQRATPEDPPARIWTQLTTDLIENMAAVIRDLHDHADDIEDGIVDAEQDTPAARLSDLRRTLIRIARFLVPQRDVLTSAVKRCYPGTDTPLFPAEIAQDAIRYVEDLNATRDHCVLMQDEISSQNTSQLNRRMLILSIAGCVFLPLTFLAGLLGMNVSGIPAANSPFAFTAVCIAMVFGTAGLVYWMSRRGMW